MKLIQKSLKLLSLVVLVAVMGISVGIHKAQAASTHHVIFQTPQQTYVVQSDLRELQQLIAQLRQLIRELNRLQIRGDFDFDSEVDISTRTPTDIDSHEAVFRGRVLDFNNSDFADVWFEYGTSRSNLNRSTIRERVDEDEDENFERRVTNLRSGTNYYYRAVGKDDEGDRDAGSTIRFRTDGSSRNDDEPNLNTRSAININDDSADLRGSVDMNDFNNGEVFFVYGEDEDEVQDVEDDFDSYSDVDEDGDDLQKVRVDSDLDGQESYEERVRNLDDNTKHYFSMCVGYEDEDDDDVIKCGSVLTFITD